MDSNTARANAPRDILKTVQVGGGFIALACLLLYTLMHTGALLADHIADDWIGYVAAVGIELAVVILSLSIGQARRTGRDTGFFYFVLVAAAVVSVIANVSEGFRANRGVGLSLATLDRLDGLQWFIAITATGLISLIVLALSEIIGTGVQSDTPTPAITEIDTKTAPLPAPDLHPQPTALPAEGERQDAQLTPEQRAMLDYLVQNPYASYTDIGKYIGKTRQTATNWTQELMQTGVIRKNGHGWEVQAQ